MEGCRSWSVDVHDVGVAAFVGPTRAKFDVLSHETIHIIDGVNCSCERMPKNEGLGMIYHKFLSSGATVHDRGKSIA